MLVCFTSSSFAQHFPFVFLPIQFHVYDPSCLCPFCPKYQPCLGMGFLKITGFLACKILIGFWAMTKRLTEKAIFPLSLAIRGTPVPCRAGSMHRTLRPNWEDVWKYRTCEWGYPQIILCFFIFGFSIRNTLHFRYPHLRKSPYPKMRMTRDPEKHRSNGVVWHDVAWDYEPCEPLVIMPSCGYFCILSIP